MWVVREILRDPPRDAVRMMLLRGSGGLSNNGTNGNHHRV